MPALCSVTYVNAPAGQWVIPIWGDSARSCEQSAAGLGDDATDTPPDTSWLTPEDRAFLEGSTPPPPPPGTSFGDVLLDVGGRLLGWAGQQLGATPGGLPPFQVYDPSCGQYLHPQAISSTAIRWVPGFVPSLPVRQASQVPGWVPCGALSLGLGAASGGPASLANQNTTFAGVVARYWPVGMALLLVVGVGAVVAGARR